MQKRKIKLGPLIVLIALTLAFFVGMSRRGVRPEPSPGPTARQTAPAVQAAAPTSTSRPAPEARPGERDGVAAYLIENGRLPDYYITKAEARKLGWTGGSLARYAPGKLIGGDRFGNYEELLPHARGRSYYECDIGTWGADSRGARRIVYSNDGLIYYTDDHYESFTLLHGGP